MGKGISLCTVYMHHPHPARAPPLTRLFPVAERVSLPINSNGGTAGVHISASTSTSSSSGRASLGSGSLGDNKRMQPRSGVRVGYGIANEGGSLSAETAPSATTPSSHILRAFACPSMWRGQRGDACTPSSGVHPLVGTTKKALHVLPRTPPLSPMPRSLLASWSDPRGPLADAAINKTVVSDCRL